MSRTLKSRAMILVACLLVPLVLGGCTPSQQCLSYCMGSCVPSMGLELCGLFCFYFCSLPGSSVHMDCAENPDECAATVEQLQAAAIQYCEENPAECSEILEYMAQPSDTDAEG